MESQSILERRNVATARRRRPSGVRILEIAAIGDGSHGKDNGICPEVIKLETTYEDGQIAIWFDDQWWMESFRRWKDRPLTVQLMPSPDALMNRTVHYKLDMVRRIQAPWRLIGYCYLSDIAHPTLMPRVASSPYDEIRVICKDRPASTAFDQKPSQISFDQVVERVREFQSKEGLATPMLTASPEPRLSTPIT